MCKQGIDDINPLVAAVIEMENKYGMDVRFWPDDDSEEMQEIFRIRDRLHDEYTARLKAPYEKVNIDASKLAEIKQTFLDGYGPIVVAERFGIPIGQAKAISTNIGRKDAKMNRARDELVRKLWKPGVQLDILYTELGFVKTRVKAVFEPLSVYAKDLKQQGKTKQEIINELGISENYYHLLVRESKPAKRRKA